MALGCNVTATRSDTPNNLVPEKATDGNTSDRNSRWSSGSTRDPASITVDLGRERTVDSVTLHWENAFPENYTVEFSGNGKTFRSIAKVKGKVGAATHKTKPTQTRFIRINMENPATQWGFCLYEIEVFGK